MIFSLSLYSDTLFVFFLILTFYFLSKFILNEQKRFHSLILLSLLLGIATLIKPASMYCPIIILIFIFIKFKNSFKLSLKYTAIFLFVFFLTLSPFLLHNYLYFNQFFLTISGDYNLLKMNLVPMEVEKHKTGSVLIDLLNEADSIMITEGKYPDIQKQSYVSSDSGIKIENGQIKSLYWRKLALIKIKNEPISFLKHYSLGVLHTFFNLGSSIYSDYFGIPKGKKIDLKKESNLLNLIRKYFMLKTPSEILIGVFIFSYLCIVYFAMVLGFWQIRNSENRLYLYLCISLFLYFILVAGSGGLGKV